MTALSLSPADVGRTFVCRNGDRVRITSEGDDDHWRFTGEFLSGDYANSADREDTWTESGAFLAVIESRLDLIARADEPAPRGEEPVAWQWRVQFQNGQWSDWSAVDSEAHGVRAGNSSLQVGALASEVRPLFAHPPADNVRTEGWKATGWVRGSEFRSHVGDEWFAEGWEPVQHIPPSTSFAPTTADNVRDQGEVVTVLREVSDYLHDAIDDEGRRLAKLSRAALAKFKEPDHE